ncbi:TonB-dependent receptor [Novosphingobium terrae]|uniref:TonB-dependent receptor n=1 Tax=Novosphingobium terrae TaxID=2726189 RepID=UPI0019812A8A|nr:TonB-dependent receptor [Novosphingobium terrae]
MNTSYRRALLLGACAFTLSLGTTAYAATVPAAPAAPAAEDPAEGPIRNTDDILVTATKVNTSTPITASVHTFEPQAIVSRSIIENSVAPTADISQVVMLTPGASITPSSGNGVGLADTKIVLRGFQDGQYNITFDGVPFADSNDPTHHSTSYFPNGTYERIIVDRGPGGATDLGQASYGGQVHIVSRELSDKFFLEDQFVYGSFNTFMDRFTVNSGRIDKLGGLKIIGVGEYKQTDGALTNQGGWWVNGFVKAELPIGNNAKFSVLSSFNKSPFHSADSAGGATAAQIAAYGKNYGAISPAQAAGSGYTNARSDWNWAIKTTDFEIARLQWDLGPNITIDNKAYTYFYKNFTLSTEDASTPCTTLSTLDQCTGTGYTNVKAIGTGAGGGGGKTVTGDIPGYTKVNQYRNTGDIFTVSWKNALGILKGGFWYEHSQSHRYRYDYDFTTASRAGGISDYTFNFNIMNNGSNWNYKETDKAANTMLNGQYVPAYIKYDEYTSWDQIQGFAEYAFKLFDDKLTLTPGVKAMDFTRKINTPIAAQSSRQGIATQQSYKPVLPYATANYLIKPDFSVYFQYAKGFIIPSLSASLETAGATNAAVPLNPQPTKTTNYQTGFVFARDRLNIDADGYYIQASNSTTMDPTTNLVTVSANPATYKGLEGQVSYVLAKGLTGIVNGTVMSSLDDVTHLWLTKAPNYTAMAGMIFGDGPFKLSYLHKFTGRQWADAANTTRIAPYSFGVLSASFTHGNLTAGITVNNLLNNQPVVAQSGSGAATLYIFQTRRSYQASLKVRI